MIKKLIILCCLSLICSASYAQGCDLDEGFKEISTAAPNLNLVKSILAECDKVAPSNQRVLFLHGLYARKLASSSGDYTQAIAWLEQANQPENSDITLELAVTYEWSNQFDAAQKLYKELLNDASTRHDGELGLARIYLAEKNINAAEEIYNRLLAENSQDVDALNGLGRIQMINNHMDKAKEIFKQVLTIYPLNPLAMTSLEQIQKIHVQQGLDISNTVNPGPFCKANIGLRLLNQKNPPINFIKAILVVCDKQLPNNEQVLLLHGLLARKEGVAKHDYTQAIKWLKQAADHASHDNDAPLLELAVTYEWAQQNAAAEQIYDALLVKNPLLRAALLGKARLAVLKNQDEVANKIYQSFLVINHQDTDVINGLGRMALKNKQFNQANQYFRQVLTIHANDQDAKIGLKQSAAAVNVSHKTQLPNKKNPPLCEANKGLVLLNQTSPDYKAILAILSKCDKSAPDDTQALLLHGLLARKMGKNFYPEAITWLRKAARSSDENNLGPALELAVTYEWLSDPKAAQQIYDQILLAHPNNKPALLGLGRVYLQLYQQRNAYYIYKTLLSQNPNDVDALTGLAFLQLADFRRSYAKDNFNQALNLQPQNNDAKQGLVLLANSEKYLLTFDTGEYTVGGLESSFIAGNLYVNLNATDQFILQVTHNSSELPLGLVLDPTLLPKNDVLVGFQRQIPNQYGYGFNYEYRSRNKFRVENRLGFNVNAFMFPNLQWLIGGREGFPSPWNNQLLYAGPTLYTSLPVNFAVTGFWGHQQTGGGTSAYAFDLSKELPGHLFYNIGTSYSPSQKSWEIHARYVYPVTDKQAFEANYEHNYFNGLSFYNIGWRFYF